MELFSAERAVWTAEEMAKAIGVSTSTAYRYTRELCLVGFLDPVNRGGFALGPAFIQYDYLLRTNDALIRYATPIMQDLIERIDPRLDVVLSRLFRNCVLCIHQEKGPEPHPPTNYARGVAMPLFVGATSKAILAHLPDRTLRRLYLDNEEAIRAAAPDRSWKNFKQELREIRKDGYSLTISEVEHGRAGLAAPVFRNGAVVASMSVVMEETVLAEVRTRVNVFEAVMASASETSAMLADDPHDR